MIGIESKLITVSRMAFCEELSRRRPTGSWTWRGWNYNRVPPAIEEAVYERFKHGNGVQLVWEAVKDLKRDPGKLPPDY